MLKPTVQIRLWIATILTGVIGVINLLSSVSPSLPDRREWLEQFLPFEIRASGHLFAALFGFLLLSLAANLLRRKRIAWLLTIALLISSILSHLLKGLDYEESLLAGILLIDLILLRKVFSAKSDPPSVAQGIRVLLGALLFTLAYGTAGFYILDNHYTVNQQPTNFGLIQSVEQTFAMFFTDDNAGLQPQNQFGQYFADSIYVVGSVTLIYAFVMLMRPVLLRGEPATSDQRQQASQIIQAFGNSSLARLALLKDKSYFFSSSGKSVVAYVPKGRAAIALGDPIGPEVERSQVISEFQQWSAQNDWFPAFYEAEAVQLDLYHSLGYRSIQVGEDAIVDLKEFSLKGKANQNLRTAVNRLTKTGHTFDLIEPTISDDLISQLKPVSDEWLKHMNGSEKQFSIAWFDADHLHHCPIGIVRAPDGNIIAFANLLTEYNRKEVTVDLMRYRQAVENGTMDFLFVSMIQHYQALGYEGFNFSLSPLSGVGESPTSPQVEKTLNYLSEHLSRFYNFKGLHRFKEKFQPRWEPRYLIFPSWTVLPDVVVGLVRVDSGDRLLDYFKPGS